MPGQDPAGAVRQYGMGVHKRTPLREGDVAGAGGDLHRPLHRPDHILPASLVVESQIGTGESPYGRDCCRFDPPLSGQIGDLAYHLRTMVKPGQEASSGNALFYYQAINPPLKMGQRLIKLLPGNGPGLF